MFFDQLFAKKSLEQLAAEAKKRQGTRTDLVAKLPGSQSQYRCPYCHRVYQEKNICPEAGRARDHAAKLTGASPRYISEAKAIKEQEEVLE